MSVYRNPLEMSVEEWKEHVTGNREYYNKLRASMSTEEWNEHAGQHNQRIANEIMEDWNCTELEAWAAIIFDCDSLEDTQLTIAQFVTYDIMMKYLPTECERFLKEEYYKGNPEADCNEFIKSEAHDMAEEEAWSFVYNADIVDDYSEMTEEMKEAVVYGSE